MVRLFRLGVGIALVLEAVWLAAATFVVIRYAHVMSTFDGGTEMSGAEALIGYAIGFVTVALFGYVGLFLASGARWRPAIGWSMVLSAACINGFVGIAITYAALTTPEAIFDSPGLVLTIFLALLAFTAWWTRSRSLA